MGTKRLTNAVLLVLAGLPALLIVWVLRPQPSPLASEQTEPPAGTVEQTANPTPTEDAPGASSWSIEHARAAIEDGGRIVVLGDSTGNDPNEWVEVWAQDLEADVSLWSNGYDDQDARILNGSVPGVTAGYVLNRADEMVPSDAGVVILNFGHNHTTRDVGEIAQLHDAIDAIAPEAPVVLTLQQPQEGDVQADVRGSIAAIAEERGLPVIDVAAAFEADGRVLEMLLQDPIHPNFEGSKIWADKLSDRLG